MSGATHNYKFGQKNNWRRRMLNWALSNPNKPKGDKSALVLLGPDLADLDVLINSKGLKPRQIWGIDTHKPNCEEAKRRFPGARVINADVAEVLESWPGGHPLDVIALDLCCNVSTSSDRVLGALLRTEAIGGPKSSCCLIVNLLRGREYGKHRDLVLKFNEKAVGKVPSSHVKHRAISAFASAAHLAGAIVQFPEFEGEMDWLIGDLLFERRAFPSYRSSNQTMDSFASQVFRCSLPALRLQAQQSAAMKRSIVAHIATASRLAGGAA